MIFRKNTSSLPYFTDGTDSVIPVSHLNGFFIFIGRNDTPINYVWMPGATHYFKLVDREEIFSNSKTCLSVT